MRTRRKRRWSRHRKAVPTPKVSRPLHQFENNPGDNRRRLENTRQAKLKQRSLEREEDARINRLAERRKTMSDSEWDATREEKLRIQAERDKAAAYSQSWTLKGGNDEAGQSDHYSGLEYQSNSVRDLSQNFYSLRRENGRFGSHPDEDSYSEEANS